ncbi:MAG: DUF3795 domain-containing protein [Theionarchaea archaeon]|nr:DUF3795 domain-containing protein [Theionarchaea archaeon]MBU7038840.1 DUF3795 domain-containing protein [Theionarchaea archaeon]
MTCEEMIAVCGLDCEVCDIRRIPFDSEAAERIVKWFQTQGLIGENEGTEEIISRNMYCKGCRGDRSVHWSPECPILVCCIDKKGYEGCHECDDFPCGNLEKQAEQGGQYREALDRLRTMRE